MLLLAQNVQHRMVKKMNWRDSLRKSSCPNLWNYPGTCLELTVKLQKFAVSKGRLSTKTSIYTEHSVANSVKEIRWIKRPFFLVFSGKETELKKHSNWYKGFIHVFILHTSLLLNAQHFWHLLSGKSLWRSEKISILSKTIWKKEQNGKQKRNKIDDEISLGQSYWEDCLRKFGKNFNFTLGRLRSM
jgi:hypothetical protein